MQPFAEYPRRHGLSRRSACATRPTASFSHSSFADSEQLAGELAWYYENDGMMPMLIGHSQGGMLAIRVLYELAGAFHESIDVWNPSTGESEQRTTIRDPLTGQHAAGRRASRFRMRRRSPPASCRACCSDNGRCSASCARSRTSVDEFTGFIDPVGSDRRHASREASPTARPDRREVRNVRFAGMARAISDCRNAQGARDQSGDARLDRRVSTGRCDRRSPAVDGIDTRNLVHAADIWFSIKKHWCVEAQRMIRQRRVAAAEDHPG